MTGRVWRLTILAPCEWLTANRNSSHNRYMRSELVRAWRQAVEEACRAGRLPCGDQQLHRITVEAEGRWRGRPPVTDSANLAPTLKAAIDGLTPEKWRTVQGRRRRVPGYGLIRDDNDKHLASSSIRIGPPLPASVISEHPGFLILNITELVSADSLF